MLSRTHIEGQEHIQRWVHWGEESGGSKKVIATV